MGNTPKSDVRMPDVCESPAGVKRSKFPDKESPNSCGTFDGSKPVVPLAEKNYLDGACGLD